MERKGDYTAYPDMFIPNYVQRNFARQPVQIKSSTPSIMWLRSAPKAKGQVHMD